MRTDLSTQLREYAEYLEEAGRRIDAERIDQRAETQTMRPRRQLRGWVVAVSAGLATLLLIGGVGVFRQDAFHEAGVDPMTSPLSAPTATTIEQGPLFDPTTISIEEIPPFRATVQTSFFQGRTLPGSTMTDEVTAMMTYEIWYDGESGWRLTSLELEGDGEFMSPGSYEVWTGSEFGQYDALTDTVQRSAEYHEPLPDLRMVIDEDIFTENCESAGTTTLLGRAVHRYSCVDEELWIDESGLVLVVEGSPVTHQVLELEINPDFPPDVFVFDPPDDATEEESDPADGFDHATVGQLAPPLVGESTNGDTFDLRESLGNPVVIVFWYSFCPPCLEHLDVIHQVAAQHEDITFVTALVEDSLSNAQTVIDQQGYTLPVLDEPASDPYLFEESGIVLGVPTTVLVNPDGTIAAVFYGKITDPEDWESYFFEGAGW